MNFQVAELDGTDKTYGLRQRTVPIVVKPRDTVFEGIDSAADAFLGLFTGANTGKMLVKV